MASVNYGREDVDSGLTHYFFHGTSGTDAGGNYAAGDLIDVDRDGIPDAAQAAHPSPDSSDDYIVSLTDYDSAGRAYKTTDNLGRENWTIYDALGRTVKTIQNYDDGVVDETDLDCDSTVEYEYDSAGWLVTMIAMNAKGDDSDPNNENVEPQATKYLYESEVNPSWQTAAVYPDCDRHALARRHDEGLDHHDRLGRPRFDHLRPPGPHRHHDRPAGRRAYVSI